MPEYTKTGTNIYMCEECGCLIGPMARAKDVHNEWHARLARKMEVK